MKEAPFFLHPCTSMSVPFIDLTLFSLHATEKRRATTKTATATPFAGSPRGEEGM